MNVKKPEEIEKYADKVPFKTTFTLIFKTMENIFTKRLDFYFFVLGCSVTTNFEEEFHYCGKKHLMVHFPNFS